MNTKTLSALGSDGSIVTRSVLPYSVNLWGSHPDAENDDCWTGEEFATFEEAAACYRDIVMFPTSGKLPKVCGYDWEYVEIDGPGLNEVTANPDQPTQRRHRHARTHARTQNDREWQREIAHQAGMSFGCDGYNGAMGY